jgi:hypothetical protein
LRLTSLPVIVRRIIASASAIWFGTAEDDERRQYTFTGFGAIPNMKLPRLSPSHRFFLDLQFANDWIRTSYRAF